jgi:DNA-binding response OmpR family regulator
MYGAPMRPRMILVVDDDVVVRNLLREVLTAHGYGVCMAQSGVEALELVMRQRPDLVLLDIAMPGMDGIETLRRIRDCCPQVPIVMLTAYGDVETASLALRQGAVDYVPKPFNVGYLERVVMLQLSREDQPRISGERGETPPDSAAGGDTTPSG